MSREEHGKDSGVVDVTCRHFPRGIEKNHEIKLSTCSCRNSNRILPEYDSRAALLDQPHLMMFS
jgi:hypothetical protein